MSTTTTTFGSHQTHLASSLAPSTISAPPQRKTMSITQTYFLAHKARAKLSSQAARPDHNLRLLVGHANLLDTLMLELAEAEREQESWFNQSVRGASQNKPASAPSSTSQTPDRHVKWAETAIEEHEEDLQAADTDDDSDASSDMSSDYSDSDEEDELYDEESPVSSPDDKDSLMADASPLYRVSSHKAIPEDEDTEEDDDEIEDDEATHAHLVLTRSSSHSSPAHISSPPELVIEEDSDIASEDDMPPSPPAVTLQSFDKKIASTITTIRAVPLSPQQEADEHDAFEEDSTAQYYLTPRDQARMITAVPVY